MAKYRLSRKKRKVYGFSDRERVTPPYDNFEYDLSDEVEIYGEEPEVSQPAHTWSISSTSHNTPELSLRRPLNTAAREAGNVALFLANVRERNSHRGYTIELGGLACELVNAPSVERMLADKYPKTVGDRRRTVQLQRRFRREYNQFARVRAEAMNKAQFEKLTTPQIHTEGLVAIEQGIFIPPVAPAEAETESDVITTETMPDMEEIIGATNVLWEHGLFIVKREFVVVNNAVAFDLSPNEQLYSEYDETKAFLQHDGLNTTLIHHTKDDQRFRPTATFFEPHQAAQQPFLTFTVDAPTHLPLFPPAAIEPR